ncbi:OTU domain-containing protein 4-like [Ptychodera flava]|uniref:OTU domain-containing protein 4-like n=1 Tax=Ptychodera flava TaxID=63121 RepID=UPI003969ED84
MERKAGFGEHEIHGAKRRKYADTEVQAKTSWEPLPTTSTITRSQIGTTDTVGSLHQDVYNILKTGHVKFLVGKLNLSQNHTVKEQEAQDKFLQSCGRYRHDIIPDGNSLYRAVAESFYGDQSEHLSLRQQTLSFVQSIDTSQQIIKGKPYHFFSSASQLGDWTKVTEIAALSYILHVNIHVLTGDKDCIIPQKFKPCNFGGSETARHIYISWLSTGHFDAITDEQNPNPEYSQWFQQQLLSNKLCVVHESDSDMHTSRSDVGIQTTEEQTRSGIDEFNALLLEVANDLGQDEFQQLVFLCKGKIWKSMREKVQNCMDLFQILEDQRLLSWRDASYLIDLLTKIKRIDLVEKVRTNHPGMLSDGISWIKTHLMQKYKKNFQNFKPIPWNENKTRSLTEIYTRLKVTESNKRERFKKGTILTNEKDIFSLYSDKRIKIEGAPGMGNQLSSENWHMIGLVVNCLNFSCCFF